MTIENELKEMTSICSYYKNDKILL